MNPDIKDRIAALQRDLKEKSEMTAFFLDDLRTYMTAVQQLAERAHFFGQAFPNACAQITGAELAGLASQFLEQPTAAQQEFAQALKEAVVERQETTHHGEVVERKPFPAPPVIDSSVLSQLRPPPIGYLSLPEAYAAVLGGVMAISPALYALACDRIAQLTGRVNDATFREEIRRYAKTLSSDID